MKPRRVFEVVVAILLIIAVIYALIWALGHFWAIVGIVLCPMAIGATLAEDANLK